jgi:hypothetical protein
MTNLLLAALLVLRLCSTALASGPSLHRRLADGAQAEPGGAAAPRCPPLTQDVFSRRARNNTVMFAVMNGEQFDFARNWLHHVKKAGIDYYVAVAADANASAQLAALGEPCVDRADEEVAKLGALLPAVASHQPKLCSVRTGRGAAAGLHPAVLRSARRDGCGPRIHPARWPLTTPPSPPPQASPPVAPHTPLQAQQAFPASSPPRPASSTPGTGLQWGHEGWRRMTWSKVFVLDAVVDYGFNLVVSDIDVVWFKDPLPLFARHPDAGGGPPGHRAAAVPVGLAALP